MTETVTPELLAEIDRQRHEHEWRAEAAAARRDSAELDRRTFAARAEQLALVRSYLEVRIGRTMEDVGREVEAEVRQLEAAYATAHQEAETAQEELRDLEGYRRVLERMHAEASDAPSEDER